MLRSLPGGRMEAGKGAVTPVHSIPSCFLLALGPWDFPPQVMALTVTVSRGQI